MKKVLIAAALIAVTMSSPAVAREWYTGGNLHKASLSQWSASTARNRLATSADFVSAIANQQGLKKHPNELKPLMQALVVCINEVARDPSLGKTRVSETVGACAIAMGWR